MKLAIVGVTGLVGNVIMDVLNDLDIQIAEFIPVASSKSVGQKLRFRDKEYQVQSVEDALAAKPNVAIFSAGGSASLEWAPKFAAVGCYVVDNSSAWRMNPAHKLVIPEVNAGDLNKDDYIIANPNCSTIQLALAMAPLHRTLGIKRMVVSTYQSFTGTGAKAVKQYENEKKGLKIENEMVYPHPIFENAIPHCDIFLDNKYTKEEMKIVNETRKILNDQNIRITSTAVRIPVFGGHSESVNVEFNKQFDLDKVVNLLKNTSGIKILDDVENNIYPTPLQAYGKDYVYVGRIRRDDSVENGLNLWIVSDNLRKGAATNAVQIVKYLTNNNFIM